MALSDAKVRNSKPKERPYKLFDGDGLFLLVTPNGKKGWRFKYRFGGKEKLISFGTYPEISLSEARGHRDAARKQVASNIDPSIARKIQKAAQLNPENSFEAIAREWHARFLPTWSEHHGHTIIRRLERNVFPWIGQRMINDISHPELLSVLHRVEARGFLETAHRVKTICGQVFRYAISTGRAERDIAADLKGALPPSPKKHYAAITDPEEIANLLIAIDGYQGTFVTQCAFKLAPLVFLRPGELRKAEWREINFEEKIWDIPGPRMKMEEPHIVPLSQQAMSIFQEIHPLTCNSQYVFPSIRSNLRPMSENTINAALRQIGYSKEKMTGHGFRAAARTILDERLGYEPYIINQQLSHTVTDPNGRAYNRTTHLLKRKIMMQHWSDYLDELKNKLHGN